MDQQTIIIGAVIAIIAILGFVFLFVLGGLFIWFASKRRANPRVRDVMGTKKNGVKGCGCQKATDCACDPGPVERCISAKMPSSDERPVAIFGVEYDECCPSGKMSQKQVQRFVDLHNKVHEEDESTKFIEKAERVFSRIKTQGKGPLNERPTEGDLVM